ncbi:cellulose synthase-like protein H1 isoform X2 [Cryptomeria japonica]|uniref:cellulose synthase-like protein H1 isoform X2 n=1 Tax=Cryptomeria japonica TaxID=3369 RepID=UPI0027DA920A|nr:cellulose synthase-like protein H1 isoform X2 [Cryptomeria japonica]
MDFCKSFSLYEKIIHESKLYRAYACIHLVFLLVFLGYRLVHSSVEFNGLWMIAFLCELCFSFHWILDQNVKWQPIDYKAYPDRLKNRYGGESASKLPSVDIIITTTDPFKEPAIMTANTVLSVLAVDYPVERIACYVSDDGSSPITFYSLVETLSFAKKWVPFCKKFNIETTAPFMYFSIQNKPSDPKFLREWQDMKVIHEGNEGDVLPHLIYVAREKRPNVDHHYKAGAMNVMARVSGIMTNAPYILNLDCDMHVSNPKAIQEAMCFFLDCPSERECGFVQFPQLFYGGLKDDPFGNRHKVFLKATAKGMNGIQGPMYFGTCCFHRRKGLYGVPPATNKEDRQGKDTRHFSSSSSIKAFKSIFGESSALVASAQTIMEDTAFHKHSSPSFLVEEAFKVASCSYEAKTAWGKEVGWMYGATAEDVLTGLKVQSLGWHSIYYTPEQSAFIGCAPGNGLDTLIQQKRWGTGLLEVFVSKSCPFLGMNKPMSLRQRMLYAYFTLWATWSVPTLCYAILPAFSLLSGKSFLPKIQEPFVFSIAVGLFLSVYGRRLLEYVLNGCSAREWWNNQRMWLIVCISSWVFALFDVAMKMVGLSETVFVVTPKGSGEEEQSKEGEFTFNSSALFIPPTTVLLINLAAICESTLRFAVGGYEIKNKPFAEYFCSVWVVINLLPFLKGLVRKGKGGLPWSVIIRSCALAMLLWTTIVTYGC